ncbi:MAG: hypothetical protein LBF83_06710 [Spirochaetaceae bacterium]|nr:hypothetical protein [Spirochaetaceae bacterium]
MEKISLKDNNGISKNGIKIIICSELNNSINKIWDKILNIETLIKICKPMATFKITTKEKFIKWKLNTEYVFKLFIYGFVPFGTHKIILETIDNEENIIKSKEHNNVVKIWNHKITMEKEGELITNYTDEVEIYAGIFTLIIAIWGIIFYKHRQKKWKAIAKTL